MELNKFYPLRVDKSGYAIISDTFPDRPRYDDNAKEYEEKEYGGYLIAESLPSREMAQAMCDAFNDALRLISQVIDSASLDEILEFSEEIKGAKAYRIYLKCCIKKPSIALRIKQKYGYIFPKYESDFAISSAMLIIASNNNKKIQASAIINAIKHLK